MNHCKEIIEYLLTKEYIRLVWKNSVRINEAGKISGTSQK